MHYIPKYSRDRQNKRQSQNFVTVIAKTNKLDGANAAKIISLVRESQGFQSKLLGFGLQK